MPGLTAWLLLGMLLLPIVGAVTARLVGQHWGRAAMRLVAGAAFLGAIGCLLVLQRSPADSGGLGQLGIFLPSRDVVVSRDALIELPTAALRTVSEPTVTATTIPSPTPAQTATPTVEPTLTPTATPTETPPPTPAPPPTEVPPPTEAPPPTAAPAPAPRRYVVESGDTLRTIAAQFDISVEALLRYNGFSPEEGDSLRVGQEIFIPPR